MYDSAVVVKDLTVYYPLKIKPAIKNINLNIEKGKFMGIIGPCNAGKTTLCLCLKGIIPHIVTAKMEGSVTVLGMDTKEHTVPELSKNIGLVLDDPEPQLTQLTVEEEIAFGLQNLGVPRGEMEERVKEVLDLVGLTGLEDRAPIDLSGGQQQRLSIGSVLAMYPKVLILDEPTSNLDPLGKQEVFSIVSKLNKEKGVTVIVVEHEVEWLAEFSDEIIFLNGGEIVASGPPEEVFNDIQLFKSVGEKTPQVTELAYKIKEDVKWPYERLPIVLQDAYRKVGQLYRLR